jgi:hypothetical protein
MSDSPIQNEAPAGMPIDGFFFDGSSRPKRSRSIAKLAAALARAQGQMENADKDGMGTYGKYATLAATWDAIRKPFADNGIAVYQRPLTIDGKPTMCTMFIHTSGEFFDDSELELKFESNNRMTAMQAMGSAVTYARRYTLQSGAGVAPADDDDGAEAGNPKEQPKKQPPPQKSPKERNENKTHAPPPMPAHVKDLLDFADKKEIKDLKALVQQVTGKTTLNGFTLEEAEAVKIKIEAMTDSFPEDNLDKKRPPKNPQRLPPKEKVNDERVAEMSNRAAEKAMTGRDLSDIVLRLKQKTDLHQLTNFEADAVMNAIKVWSPEKRVETKVPTGGAGNQ